MRGLLPWMLLAAPCLAAAQLPLTLELLSPREERSSTSAEFINLLGRTLPGAVVQVGGAPVTVFGTGVFARDRIALAPGLNTLLIEARGADGQTAARTIEVERVAPPQPALWPPDRLWLDGASLQPAQALRVAPTEAVEVSLRATPGQRVEARLPGLAWQPLFESRPGHYRAKLFFGQREELAPAPVQVRVSARTLPLAKSPRSITALTAGAVGLWRDNVERLFVVGPEGAALVHGLHEVRLGGPNLAELAPGTMLTVTGQRGDRLRVQLAPDQQAWAASDELRPAPAGSAAPQAFFTSLSVSGGADGDVVQIPLPAAVPYAVRLVSDASGWQRLELEVFGAHHATTWITQRADARVVREVTAEQVAPGRVRVRIALREPRLWGWRVERGAGALRIVLRAAPTVAREGSPLAGLHVALEPGHGGDSNLGARGATGIAEKDINRWTVQALKAELETAGARVTVVREGDDNPTLRERAERVNAADAQLFVSVHANAADTTAGYLRVGGVSTYYKHASGRDLAAAVQRRLLAQTGLADFGLVGNFNYAPIRLVTWMPAVLVEQAFVTHPGDEAKLLDPDFRALMARAVRQGLEDFLRPP